MIELSLPYIKELATQIIFISAFLGGFSAAILGTLIVSKRSGKVFKALILGTSFSATSFIVSVFSMTKLVMISTPGYPLPVDQGDTIVPQILGSMAFFLGIISILSVIGLSGWLQSKKLGIATTTMALISIIVFMIVS